MKLRAAIKIMRRFDDWLPPVGTRLATCRRARAICLRRRNDRRIPFIETFDDKDERFAILGAIVAEALIEDPAERGRVLERLFLPMP